MGLLESVRKVMSAEKDMVMLRDFAIAQHREKFKSDKPSQNRMAFNYFTEFNLEDENTMVIFYKYGEGEFEYIDQFVVDLKPFFRDEKINKIVNEL